MIRKLSIISSMATRQILADLVKTTPKALGCEVALESVGGVEAATRIRAGVDIDIAVLAADALSRLADDGFILRDSVRVFARSHAALAVRAGTGGPQSLDEASIRQLFTAARAIALSTGPSGAALQTLLKRWDVVETASRRIVQAPPGVPVARLIAAREADVGVQQLSELIGERGIDIIGVVPETLLAMTTFSVGVCSAAQDPVRARALIRALTAADADPAKQRFGMEPAAEPQ